MLLSNELNVRHVALKHIDLARTTYAKACVGNRQEKSQYAKT